MKIVKTLIMTLLVALLVGSPALAAVDYFSVSASGETAVEVDVHSSSQPGNLSGKGQIIVTHLSAYSDLIGADLDAKAFIAGNASTTLASAATITNEVTFTSTSEFSEGDYIFIESATDANSFESVVISSIALKVVTLTANLENLYSSGSTVKEISNVANLEPYPTAATTEVTYGNSKALISVPEGSPLLVRLVGTAQCKLSISGLKE